MSSEEHFTKFQNALNTLAEHHARHAEEMAEMRSEFRSMQKVVFLAIERTVEIQQAGAKRSTKKCNACVTLNRLLKKSSMPSSIPLTLSFASEAAAPPDLRPKSLAAWSAGQPHP
jgi:hypothetical protein